MEPRPQLPQHHQQSSIYGQSQFSTQTASSSTVSSAFQSSSSLASVQIASDQNNMMQMQMPANSFASAPLPSPAATKSRQQSTCYFGSSSQSNGPTSHPQHPHGHGLHMPSTSRLPQHQQFNTPPLAGQRGGETGGAPETAPFLMQANLLAEAAKRAQMACLMRDMDDITL